MRALIILGLLAAGCGGDDDGEGGGNRADGGGDDTDAASDQPDARTAEPGESLGTFELTYYWVAFEGDHGGGDDTSLFDPGCALLATVSSEFADAIALEGTGRLLDGRLLNVAGGCDCDTSPCYIEADADHPWGYGVQNRALVPFRSLAVDRDVIEYGTGLYLPALDGLTVPGEAPWGDFAHDGCAVAADTGGAIVGMHIDFFVGIRDAYLTLDGELGLSETEVRDGGERCPDEPSG
jgi:3D (Asp-Asp-Asp) domain-containing protein